MLNASTGTILAQNGVMDAEEMRGFAVIGNDLYVGGTVQGFVTLITAGSVTIDQPALGMYMWSYLIKFTTTASSMAPTAGTWLGSDEYVGDLRTMQKAHGVAGYPNALLLAVNIEGSKLKVGTGFVSRELYPAALRKKGNRYSVGVFIGMTEHPNGAPGVNRTLLTPNPLIRSGLFDWLD